MCVMESGGGVCVCDGVRRRRCVCVCDCVLPYHCESTLLMAKHGVNTHLKPLSLETFYNINKRCVKLVFVFTI